MTIFFFFHVPASYFFLVSCPSFSPPGVFFYVFFFGGFCSLILVGLLTFLESSQVFFFPLGLLSDILLPFGVNFPLLPSFQIHFPQTWPLFQPPHFPQLSAACLYAHNFFHGAFCPLRFFTPAFFVFYEL